MGDVLSWLLEAGRSREEWDLKLLKLEAGGGHLGRIITSWGQVSSFPYGRRDI